MLQTAFRPSCMNRASVFEWHKRFKKARESVRGNERCGRSKEVNTPKLIGQYFISQLFCGALFESILHYFPIHIFLGQKTKFFQNQSCLVIKFLSCCIRFGGFIRDICHPFGGFSPVLHNPFSISFLRQIVLKITATGIFSFFLISFFSLATPRCIVGLVFAYLK